MTGNYIVVSAMIRTSLFKQLGGFHGYESLEDWDLRIPKTSTTGKHVSGNLPYHRNYDYYKVVDSLCNQTCLEAFSRKEEFKAKYPKYKLFI